MNESSAKEAVNNLFASFANLDGDDDNEKKEE